jgi:tetratricopeptide (TPR) repeat protein
VKPPPAAPTVKAKKEAAEKSVSEKPKGKAPNWLILGGAVLLVLCLALGALAVAGRGIRNNQLRRTETAAAALATLPPTPAPPPTPPPPTHAPPTGVPPTHASPDTVAQAETAVAADVNSIPAHLNLAKAYYEAGRRDDAIREWQKAAELAGYSPDFYRNDIMPYLKDDPITALDVLIPGLRHNSKREMWDVVMPVIDRATPLPEAEPVLQKLVDEFPDNPGPRAALARHYIINDQIERAKPIVDDLRQRFPDEAVTHFVSADYFQATGQIDQAIAELEAVVSDPRTLPPMRRAAQDRINQLKGTPNP